MRTNDSLICVVAKWLCSIIILCALCVGVYYLTFKLLFDGFKLDLENTYINNIFETGRFSAIPGLDVSIFAFILLNIFVFWILRNKSRCALSPKLFLFTLVVSLVFILFIGVMYIHSWGAASVARYDEYLHGFAGYMYLVEGIWIMQWIFQIVYIIRHRNNDKL